MLIIVVATIGLLISASLSSFFPWNIGIGLSCLVGCAYWWYDIYDRAQCIYRDWKISKANIKILKQKRLTILKEILTVIDKYADWNLKAIEQSSDSTPGVWWLQERYPNKLDTMENSKYYINILEQIETQINDQKMATAKLAGFVRQMKMDQFLGLCTPNYIVIEMEQDVVSNSLI